MSHFPDAPPPGSGEPAINAPPATVTLVLAIVGVYLVLQILPINVALAIEDLFSLVPARVALALADPLSPAALVVAASFVTHAFLHLDLMHIVANAGFLLAFGSFAERAVGRRRYLGLLLASVLAGAGAQLLVDWGRWVSLLGASAAASGCLGTLVRFLLTGSPPDPKRRRFGLALLAAMVLVNLLFAVLGPSLLPLSGDIAWEAHLGGFVAGYLLSGRRAGRA
jgi:membrane associated rhomboid family serine protease